uniref:Adenylate cyclase type 7 n=1 Tax=Ursus maritimus TaxID=29073 RepID=A0A452TJ90_URSMA
MPAKGRYFLNEGEEGPDQTALYEKYRLTSQHGPLLLTLLLVAVAACVALIVITFVCGDPSRHQAVLGTAFFTLAVFVALYVLVYVECLVRRWLRAMALFVWVCLMMLGYMLVFDSWMKATHMGVPFFLFIVFVAYTLLPFSMQGAVVAGVVSSLSHLLVLGVLMKAFTTPSVKLLANAAIFLCGNLTGAFHKHQMQDASRDLFIYTVKCIQIRRKLRIEKRQQVWTLPPPGAGAWPCPALPGPSPALYVKRHQNVRWAAGRACARDCSPKELVVVLNELFGKFDQIAKANECMRIKILGDCYYCVSGLPVSLPTHARNCVKMGLDMCEAIKQVREATGVDISMRVGIHSGNVLCGVIGLRKWQYDVWSHDVSLANRMDRVHITEATLNHLDKAYEVEDGHGQQRDPYLKEMNIRTYLVIDPRSQQPPPPSQHLPKPKGDAALKMRASVRMTRYLESWGAARPFAHLNHRESMSSGETPVPSGRRPKTIPLRRHRTPDRNASPKGRSEDDSYDEEMLSAIEGLSSTRPCCSKSDDFYTFGSIFLEKDFEREVRVPQQPEERGLQARGGVRVQGFLLSRMAALGVSFGLVACVLGLVLGLCFAREFPVSERPLTGHLARPRPAGPLRPSCPGDSYCILAFIACSVFLRMSLELKVVLLTVALVAYLVLFNISPCWQSGCCGHTVANLTETNGTLSSSFCMWKDPKAMINFYLVLFYVTLLMLSRQIDYYCRLDCLWKTKFKKEHEEFETMENVNRLLLENVLPAHVAAHFIGDKLNEDWYHQSYDCVCVMFASVPDFKVFYTECDVNKEGLECLRLLNEIIADFDELLLKPKFSSVEKIKTIGSTYMAAAGLSSPSGAENQDLERQHAHIGIMVEFSIALMSKLDGINRHSFNSFRLRVGINHGPVIAGVIGARKPQYDIWGNTVNVASRMESTGELGKIQVTEETCTILQGLGYSCECRGLINVKGKGELRTYFVCTDTAKFQGLGLN